MRACWKGIRNWVLVYGYIKLAMLTAVQFKRGSSAHLLWCLKSFEAVSMLAPGTSSSAFAHNFHHLCSSDMKGRIGSNGSEFLKVVPHLSVDPKWAAQHLQLLIHRKRGRRALCYCCWIVATLICPDTAGQIGGSEWFKWARRSCSDDRNCEIVCTYMEERFTPVSSMKRRARVNRYESLIETLFQGSSGLLLVL